MHLFVFVSIAPWLSQYLDHAPESTTGLLTLRYLLGTPIGFIGGNFVSLSIYCAVIIYGLSRFNMFGIRRACFDSKTDISVICLLSWLVLPCVLLYIYSFIYYPIFGPARYTLAVCPAYLLLVARGLCRLPRPLGIFGLAVSTILSGVMMLNDVYRPDSRANWKDAASFLNRHVATAPVFILVSGTFGSTAVETARYYLGPKRDVYSWLNRDISLLENDGLAWVSIGLHDHRAMNSVSSLLLRNKVIYEVVDFSSLRLLLVNFRQSSNGTN